MSRFLSIMLTAGLVLSFSLVTAVPAMASPDTWLQTDEAEFNLGTLNQVDTSSSPGDVQLATTTVTLGDSSNDAVAQPYQDDVYGQEDSSYTITYNGRITSWSYNNSGTASDTNNVRLEFLSGSGATWTMEAQSDAVTVEAGLNTFSVSIPVSAGWQIGLFTGTPRNLWFDTSSGTVTRRTEDSGDFDVGVTMSDFIQHPNTRHLPITVDLLYFLSSGTLTSSIHDTGGTGTEWNQLSWDETLNGETIVMTVRTGNNSDMSDATIWTSASTVTNGQDISVLSSVSDGDRYIQYRAELSTSDTSETPVLHEVRVEYDTNDPPDTPTNLGPTEYVNGSWGDDDTPTLTFDQNDPNGDDVQYTIQIDNDSDFSSPAVNQTSGLAAPDGASFTPPALPEDDYYWRVMSTDEHGATSGWAVANGGAVAFRLDTTTEVGWTTKETYRTNEDVKVGGSGFTPGSAVDVYVVRDYAWSDGDAIPVAPPEPFAMETFTADGSGDFGPLVIWSHPLDLGEYDVVFDADRNGFYDEIPDVVDHPNHPGFTVVTATVGGEVYPIDKAALLLPWLGLGLVLVLAAGGLILVRRQARR